VYSLYFNETQVALVLGSAKSPLKVKVSARGRNQKDSRDLFLVVQVAYSPHGKIVNLKLSEKSIHDIL
jgi:hypothetical protein